MVFEDAAWIPSDGRFTQCINEGKLDEIEPVNGIVRLNMSSIVDVFCWEHPLPRTQK
jgi:hypothetical protein